MRALSFYGSLETPLDSNGDPLKDVAEPERVTFVMKSGVVYEDAHGSP